MVTPVTTHKGETEKAYGILVRGSDCSDWRFNLNKVGRVGCLKLLTVGINRKSVRNFGWWMRR
jgi:hypothetical protein